MIEGFPPIAPGNARLLILGTMPSVKSLEAAFYYAHPRNAFWPMMAEILGEALPEDAPGRSALLCRHGIALWDVLRRCQREGSLDSAIRDEEPNDFSGLYARCPGIRRVLFNGAEARRLYLKFVNRLPEGCDSSTSHARNQQEPSNKHDTINTSLTLPPPLPSKEPSRITRCQRVKSPHSHQSTTSLTHYRQPLETAQAHHQHQ